MKLPRIPELGRFAPGPLFGLEFGPAGRGLFPTAGPWPWPGGSTERLPPGCGGRSCAINSVAAVPMVNVARNSLFLAFMNNSFLRCSINSSRLGRHKAIYIQACFLCHFSRNLRCVNGCLNPFHVRSLKEPTLRHREDIGRSFTDGVSDKSRLLHSHCW